MNKRKILVIGAAMMSVAAIAVAGIYVKRKVRDPKVEAVNLLQQLPDNLAGSQYNESLGVKDLLTNCLTGQSEANVRLSQVSSSALIKEWIPAAYKEGAVVSQDLSLSTNAQTDVMNKKCRGTVVLQSGKNLLSGEMYAGKDEVSYALPECMPDTVFTEESDSLRIQRMNWTYAASFLTDLGTYVTENASGVEDELHFEKSSNAKGEKYKLTLDPDGVETLSDDLIQFLEGQTEFISLVNASHKDPAYDVESRVKQWLQSGIQKKEPLIVRMTSKEGELKSVRISWGEKGLVQIKFTDKKDNNTKSITVTGADGKAAVRYVQKESCKDTYKQSVSLSFPWGEEQKSFYLKQTYDPVERSIAISGNWNKEYKFQGSGLVKDMLKGSSLTYALDDFDITRQGQEVLNGELQCRLALRRQAILSLSGQETGLGSVTEDTVRSLRYTGLHKLMDMGVLNPAYSQIWGV